MAISGSSENYQMTTLRRNEAIRTPKAVGRSHKHKPPLLDPPSRIRARRSTCAGFWPAGGSAPDALDLFLDAQLFALQFRQMDRVGEWSVDFFIDFVFEAGVFCFQRFDTIFDGHPLPPWLDIPCQMLRPSPRLAKGRVRADSGRPTH